MAEETKNVPALAPQLKAVIAAEAAFLNATLTHGRSPMESSTLVSFPGCGK